MNSRNKKMYNEIFKKFFKIKNEKKLINLKYQSINLWDSINHMALVAELEKKFKVNFDTEDIFGFSSYKKGLSIIEKLRIKK